MQLDGPADKIRVGLLPERFLGFSEKLVEQSGNGVGQGVTVEVRIVQGVPLPGAAQADLRIVVSPAGVLEDLPDGVAEVALDLQDQGRRPPARIASAPGQELLGEGVHTGAGLAAAHRAEDGHAGIKAALGNDEPLRPGNLARLNGMVNLAHNQGRGRVFRRDGPSRQAARQRAAIPLRPGSQPYLPDRQAQQAGQENSQPWREYINAGDDGIHEGIGGPHQVKQCDLSRGWPRREPHAQGHGRQGQVDQNDLAPGLHLGLPAGITVEGATPKSGEVHHAPRRAPVNLRTRRMRGRKMGGRSLHQHTLLYGASSAPEKGGDTRGAASPGCTALDAGNPLIPRPMRSFGKPPTTPARAPPS